MPAPLGNQLEPKPGQNWEAHEQRKKPITWLVTKKHLLGQFRVSQTAD
jgi:hypothetical protein